MSVSFYSRSIRALRRAFSALALLTACILLLVYKADAGRGVQAGISACLESLIPALFPFVLLSALFSGARTADLLCRPLAPILQFGFRLPACAAPALLFGLTAGYPAGAGITAALYADGRLTREQAARLLCSCTAPGYAFSCFAGEGLSGGARTGLFFFLSSLLPPLCFGLLLARFAPKPAIASAPPTHTAGFTETVRRSTGAMVTLCSFVVVFSALLAVLERSGFLRFSASLLCAVGLTHTEAEALLRFLLEVTAGVRISMEACLPPVLTAFGLGFAGICIHLQIYALFSKTGFPLSKWRYSLMRLCTGFFTAGTYLLLQRLFPRFTDVAATGTPLHLVPAAGSPAASAALLLLSVFFLLSCSGRTDSPSKKLHTDFTFRGWKSGF